MGFLYCMIFLLFLITAENIFLLRLLGHCMFDNVFGSRSSSSTNKGVNEDRYLDKDDFQDRQVREMSLMMTG